MAIKHKTKYLLNLNFLFTFLILTTNIITFFIVNYNKSTFLVANIYIAILFIFIHYFSFINLAKERLTELKKEQIDKNYSAFAIIFGSFLALSLITSFLILYIVNKDALNTTFVFNIFINIIFSLFPTIIFLAHIFYIVPKFILEKLSIKSIRNKSLSIPLGLSLCFLFVCILNCYTHINNQTKIEDQQKFKANKLTSHYSTSYLRPSEEVSAYGIKKMSLEKVTIPFLYTKDPIPSISYENAETFCKSIGGRIPNHLEAYYIVFNNFGIFGDEYYWTSSKDWEYNLQLHFKNMSYTIEKRKKNVIPKLYCVTDINPNNKHLVKNFFTKEEYQKNTNNNINGDTQPIEQNQSIPTPTAKQENIPQGSYNDINTEKNHVIFSIKEVTKTEFINLRNKGYYYNPNDSISNGIDISNTSVKSKIADKNNEKQIRLCYFPFISYSNFSLKAEREIWEQSFCSPAFEVLDTQPALKTKHEKDAFCYSRGGRVPNIPELKAILLSLNYNNIGTKFWINTTISDGNKKIPLIIFNENNRFMKITPITDSENEYANTFCIKNSSKKSSVISNYSSRFPNVYGQPYAKRICPNCSLHEIPDVILEK